MKPQLQTVTISGQPCAIVPLAEYDALREDLEDAADSAALWRAQAENAKGEPLPAASFHRILRGENPVRVWREFRGMQIAELADAAGISSTTLPDIEMNGSSSSEKILKHLAEALGVHVDEIR